MHAYNGVLQEGVDTVARCLDVCRSMSDCVAVDFNTEDMECFTHVDGYLSYINELSYVDQYRRASCITQGVYTLAD